MDDHKTQPGWETATFRRPRLAALILLVLIASGASALLSLGRQEDPTITNLFANITTNFPGADPGRVEALVTAPIEEELREIEEVNVVESVSRQGVSVISVELIETVEEAKIEQIWSEARDAVEDARRDFPAGVMAPDFNSEGISAYSAVIAVAAEDAAVPHGALTRHAEALADRLRSVPATRAVELFGVAEEEVLVRVDPDAAAALGLTADAISAAIQGADGKVQAGRVQAAETDLTIAISGEVEALDRLRDVVLREGSGGAVTRLDDIAEISRGPRTPHEELASSDGRPAVLVGVLAQDGVQIDRWMGWVREELVAGADAVPAGIAEDLVFDQSRYTAARLAEVGTNMAIGMALVISVLFVTLGLRAAAIVALVLPVVSLATLASMNIIGLPIHQMSVTGLIVALGLLVDAAIVMSDEIGQRLRAGLSRLSAVQGSVRRLAAPLFASTVTTALSFMPMILLPGPAGDFVGAIAIAVVLMLFWSLLMALTVTPALAGWALPEAANAGFLSSGIRGGALGRVFAATIRWSLNNPIRSVALALILPVMGFMSLPTLTAQFFPGVDRDQFYIEVEMPSGTAIADTAATVDRIDGILEADARIAGRYWSIGKSGPAFYYNIVTGRSREPGYAQAMVTTVSDEATADIVPVLQARLDTEIPGARVLVRALVQGPPVSAPVELRIVGPDTQTLRAIADEARAMVADIDTVSHVRTTIGPGAPQIRFQIDEGETRLLGLNLTDVARQLEAGLVGVTGGSLVESTEQLPVRVRLGDGVRGDLSAIAALPILPADAAAQAAAGNLPVVPLAEIAELTLEPADPVITRRNGERMNVIQAYLVPDVLPEEALVAIRADLDAAGFALPPGYRLEIGGDSDARSTTLNNMLASVGIIVTLTIATIALTFDSFRLTAVALVVCVLSAGLSMLALALLQHPFGINAIIGVIGSIGVSINAAIIILTGLQANARASAGDREAMATVVTGSSRHIVSTTLTTFGGFLPLILEGGGFWPPFATSIAGGVLLSTVVSFYFTPPLFALIYRRKIAENNVEEPSPVILEPADGRAVRLAAE